MSRFGYRRMVHAVAVAVTSSLKLRDLLTHFFRAWERRGITEVGLVARLDQCVGPERRRWPAGPSTRILGCSQTFLGGVISSIVGEGIAELLFPGSSKPQAPPPEGVWNASLGNRDRSLKSLPSLTGTPARLDDTVSRSRRLRTASAPFNRA